MQPLHAMQEALTEIFGAFGQMPVATAQRVLSNNPQRRGMARPRFLAPDFRKTL